MKKNLRNLLLLTVVLGITGPVLGMVPGQTEGPVISKEEIIEGAWKAMFGELKKEEVKSIYVEGYFHGSEIPNRMTVCRPDKFRNEVRGGILVFDGEKAAWVKRTPDEKGNPRHPEIIGPEAWPHFEVDIALIFPAFFEYDSEFRGLKDIGGKEFYEIYVNLPKGAYISYFIDVDDFLVKRRRVSWEGKPGEELWENTIEKYLPYEDGIRFPDGYSFKGQKGWEKGYYKNVKLNPKLDSKRFAIPENLK